jgi:hypothetical protein
MWGLKCQQATLCDNVEVLFTVLSMTVVMCGCVGVKHDYSTESSLVRNQISALCTMRRLYPPTMYFVCTVFS